MKKNQFVIIFGVFIVVVFLFGMAFGLTQSVDRVETELKIPSSVNEIWAQ